MTNPMTETLKTSCTWSLYGFFLYLTWGCSTQNLQRYENAWKIYKNYRYGFEFPYPSNWQEMRPVNGDGIIFISPTKNSVKIIAWAGNQLFSHTNRDRNTRISTNPNFKNVQGISGVMTIETGVTESIITLKFARNQIKYYWQGKAPSQEFDDYYRFFHYIAQNYRLSEDR